MPRRDETAVFRSRAKQIRCAARALGDSSERTDMKTPMLKAIFTDSQLWVPVVVLAMGIALLIYLG